MGREGATHEIGVLCVGVDEENLGSPGGHWRHPRINTGGTDASPPLPCKMPRRDPRIASTPARPSVMVSRGGQQGTNPVGRRHPLLARWG